MKEQHGLHKLISDSKLSFALILFVLLANAPLFLSEFRANLLGKFICYAILALGIDVIWGYTGILSLGHSLYFGLGAYCMGMYLKLESSKGALPDFMKWSGLKELPGFWQPFRSPVFAIFMALLVPTVLALIIGLLTFRNRIKGVYFSILSQALALIATTLIIGQQAYTGGSNGLTGFQTLFGHSLSSSSTKQVLYYISLAVLFLAFGVCYVIISKRTGKVITAIRDSENRVRFTGYNPTVYKLFVYAFSALLAGIAGALYITQVGIISPTDMTVVASVEMVIWVAIGGRGTLTGAIIGTILINYTKNLVSERFPDIWSYFIGLAFILVMLFMPKGIAGLAEKLKKSEDAEPRHLVEIKEWR